MIFHHVQFRQQRNLHANNELKKILISLPQIVDSTS
ncbi:unnamed protein product [Tenebrio molitor]|nr:unnamed protein product [Tenebrio molitor]